MSYAPLHNHTEFSPLDGFSHPEEYLQRASELGLRAFAVTEHGNMYSWVYFHKLKEKYPDIKIIYGVEVYECDDMSIKDSGNRYYHLVLLAKNEAGRQALNDIVTESNFKGFYYKPRVDLNLLKKHGDNLVVLSACLASKLSRESNFDKCIEYINEYKKIFPNFYLEMQSHSHIDQELYNKKILELSKVTNTPFTITTDSHVALKEDLEYQGRHIQIAQDRDSVSEVYEGCYLQSEKEIHEIMDKQVGKDNVSLGLKVSNDISDLIEDVQMPFQQPRLPHYPLPNGFNSDADYLRELVNIGWAERKVDDLSEDEIAVRRERVEYELSVIEQMGFEGYFIIVWDFINYAKRNKIKVADGRGSGAGSYVCYLLKITNLDPIKYGLIFQRFLNPERVGLPDIDSDFSDRDKVVKYITEKYGKEKVCQIINFSYISPLNAIKDTCRVLQIPYKIADSISKRFTYPTFEECLEHNPTLVDEYPEYEDMFRIASKISGRVRGVSIHAGGVGIVDTEMHEYMAMKLGEEHGEQVIQVDKRVIEDIGIIKFDILGVATLSLVQDVMEEVGLTDWDLDVNNPAFENDKASYDLLCRADTNAVFQVESAGMKDLLTRLQPRNLEELSAVIALYRPDSMGSLEHYIANKHDSSLINYIHKDMEPILGVTYGCMIYQEQLLDIVKTFGGRTYGGADKFRKAIGKKLPELVKAEAEKLYQEIIDNGYSKEIARAISDELKEKGGYLFNKSHSFAYAILCLQTAYLKAHYPVQFYKALLNLKMKDNGKINKYINDAINNGVKVLPPNINKSGLDFTVSDNKVLFGLASITGLGESSLRAVIEERELNGTFDGLDDLLERTNITESQFVSLVKSGAIPCRNKRNILLRYVKQYCYDKKQYSPVVTLPKLSILKDLGIDTDVIKDKEERLRLYNIVKEQNYYKLQEKKNEKILKNFEEKHLQDEEMWEFETLSFFLSHNPFIEVYEHLTPYEDVENGIDVVIVGVIADLVKKKDKHKRQFAFINIYTAYGLVEVCCWSSVFSQYVDVLKKGVRLAVLCNKNDDKYTAKEMKSYNRWKQDIGIVSKNNL